MQKTTNDLVMVATCAIQSLLRRKFFFPAESCTGRAMDWCNDNRSNLIPSMLYIYVHEMKVCWNTCYSDVVCSDS